MWQTSGLNALVKLTKLEPRSSCRAWTCVLAIRVIKIPLRSATIETAVLSTAPSFIMWICHEWCIYMHKDVQCLTWNNLAAIYQLLNLINTMHRTSLKINKASRLKMVGGENDVFPDYWCSASWPTHTHKHSQRQRGHRLTCFSCRFWLSVVHSLQTVFHSLQWRLMVPWPPVEECQLSPQLHTNAKSECGRWGQRSSMMWRDPAQSMDTGSWPLAKKMILMWWSNWTDDKERRVSEKWLLV